MFLLAFELLNILFEDFNLFRLRVNGQTQLGGCLVNQVNRLIRQKTIVDIPGRQLDCRL